MTYYSPPPPPQVHYIEEASHAHGKPYFFECDGKILNLAAATKFYVDHVPFTSLYWPCASIAGNSYQLTASMSSKEEAMQFLRELVQRITKIED